MHIAQIASLYNLEEEKISSQGGLQAPRACSTQAEMFGSDPFALVYKRYCTRNLFGAQEIWNDRSSWHKIFLETRKNSYFAI